MNDTKKHFDELSAMLALNDIPKSITAAQRLLAALVQQQIKTNDPLKKVQSREHGRPTADDVRDLLDYNPETGDFHWKKPGLRRRSTDLAGTTSKDGYVSIVINYKAYKAHRLAWLHVHGKWPNGPIDHINGNPSDNRIENLREVTHMVNSQNRVRASKASALQSLGVYETATGFRATITSAQKTLSLGTFRTKEDAEAAYLNARRLIHAGNTI